MSIVLEPDTAFAASVLLLSTGTLIASCEHLATSRQLRGDGFYSWPVLRTLHPRLINSPTLDHLCAVLFAPRSVMVMQGIQVVAVVGLSWLMMMSREAGPMLGAVIALVVICHCLLHYRNHFGFDGSDQMRLLVWIALGAYCFAESASLQWLCLGFIAGQSLLAYVAAGIAKLMSPTWRSGAAIGQILRTETYGSRSFSQMFGRYHLSTTLCWATILFECLAPALVVLGPPGAFLFIGLGLIFHIGIALAMGLNTFVWSFAATYPAVLIISTRSSL